MIYRFRVDGSSAVRAKRFSDNRWVDNDDSGDCRRAGMGEGERRKVMSLSSFQ